jgi:hypothetical protein
MNGNENVGRKLKVQYCDKDVCAYINNFCTLDTLSLSRNLQKRPFERLRHRRQDNIKMDLKVRGCEGVWLRIRSSDWFL